MSESTTGAALSIGYDVEEQDIGSFQRWYLRHDGRAWLPYVLKAMVAVPAAILFGLVMGQLWMGFLFLAIFAILLEREQRKRTRTIAHQAGILGHHVLEADEDGVVYRGVNGALRQPWRHISRIVAEGGRTFLILGVSSAIVLPHRVFSTPEEAARFHSELQRLREAALLRPEAPPPVFEAPPGSLVVELELNEADLKAAQLYPLKKAAGALVFLGLIPTAATVALAVTRGPLWALLHAAVIGALLVVMAILFQRERHLLASDPTTLSRRILLASGQGIQVVGSGKEEGMASWVQVKAVDADRSYLYVQWQQENVLLIPRRCFPTGAESEAFLQQIRQWHRGANPLPARK